MSETLQNEIRQGLGIASWDESINAIQTAVARALSRLDRRVRIQRTGYFNHSFVPDFILTWPGADTTTRDLFLRLGLSPGALFDDLTTMDTSEPILLDVGESISPTETRALTAVTEGRDALVADAGAVTGLEPQIGGRYAQVLPSTMLKGGRGVIGAAVARSLQTSASAFFDGAAAHSHRTIEGSARNLFRYLSKPAYSRLANLGRIVWEATGGDATDFPLPAPLGAGDDDNLLFLLQGPPIEDPTFWRSIGDSVSFDRLVNLDPIRTRNLRFLVAANMDRLRASVIVVRPLASDADISSNPASEVDRASDPSRTARWSVVDRALVYHGTAFVACTTTSRECAPNPVHNTDWQPLLADVVTRLGVLPLESVSARTPDGRSVTVKSATHLDIPADETLRNLLDQTSFVESLGIRVDESKTLTCHFADRSASGADGSSFDLAHLLRAALPLLAPLQRDDIAEMRWMAAHNAELRSRHPSAEDDLGPW